MIIFCTLPLSSMGLQPSASAISREYKYLPLKTIDISSAGLVNPVQLAVEGGYIYVVDDFSNAVYKFDPEGALVAKVDQINGEFLDPYGLAVAFDYIYLTNRRQGNLIKFTKSMLIKEAYTIDIYRQLNNFADQTEKLLSEPRGTALDIYGDLYIVDSGRDYVLKLNNQGQVAWQLGSFGTGDKNFNEPIDVGVDRYLNIYVVDQGNGRVSVFDQNRELIYQVKYLKDPRGIAIDSRYPNLFYVADYGQRAVLVYQDRQLKGQISLFKSEQIDVQDIYFNSGQLYVLDPLKKLIYCYEVK